MPPLKENVAVDDRIVRVGILEVQGAFLEHKAALHKAAKRMNIQELQIQEVRTADDIRDDIDGLIIPGGESTAISLYLRRNNMVEPLRKWILHEDHVTWGTCAGMILLSKVTENQKTGGQSSLDVMDTDVSRNFFGRQIQSFESTVQILDTDFTKATGCDSFPGVFIRAPAILEVLSDDVKVVGTLQRPGSEKDVIVAAQQGQVLSTAFHPELTENCSWHIYFLKMIQSQRIISSRMNDAR